MFKNVNTKITLISAGIITLIPSVVFASGGIEIDTAALQTLSKVAGTAIVIMMTFALLFGVFSIAIAARNLAAAKTPSQRSEAMSGLFGAIVSIAMASAVPLIFRLIVELINTVS